MTPEVGQRFGPYEILAPIGSGGMGLVFRAWDERLYREVAIKIVRDSYRIPGTQERFLQEARAASRLNHPNICTVFDIGEQDEAPYLVMELLEGQTLKQAIARRTMAAEEVVACALEVAQALALAHSHGIIHRDIKPANIFLAQKPGAPVQIKVLDFGLAKIARRGVATPSATSPAWQPPQSLPDESTLHLTVEGVTVGTVSYMSPEQATGQKLDARSDLFSLGVVMYEMATRRLPFIGANAAETFARLLEQDPEPVRHWNDTIPRDLERIILRLLEKDRRRRFQNAQDLVSALQHLSGRVTKGAWFGRSDRTPVVPIVATREPVPRKHRKLRTTKDVSALPSTDAPDLASVHIRPRHAASIAPSLARAVEPSPCTVLTHPGSSSDLPIASGSETVPQTPRHQPHSIQQPPVNQLLGRPRARLLARVILGTLALLGTLVLAYQATKSFHATAMLPSDVLLLAPLKDNTGENLQEPILTALELALSQSPAMTIRGESDYQAVRRYIGAQPGAARGQVSPRAVAQTIGAKVYLFGRIDHIGDHYSAYTIHLDVLKTTTNDHLFSLSEEARSQSDLLPALDRISRTLRSRLGEDEASINSGSDPIAHYATSSMEALRLYAQGAKADQSGDVFHAIVAYQNSVAHDIHFAHAQMQLAWLYEAQHAELAAADAARKAGMAASQHNQRLSLLAEFVSQTIAENDDTRAATLIRRYNQLFADDFDGLVNLARVLRLQGHFVESLLAAQKAIQLAHFRYQGYREASLDLIGLSRFDDARRLHRQAASLGIVMESTPDIGTPSLKVSDSDVTSARTFAYRALADDVGQDWREGELYWKRAVSLAARTPGLQSASTYYLHQAALNRAIAGRCSDALSLLKTTSITPTEPTATFRGAVAAAICGDLPRAEAAIKQLEQQTTEQTSTIRSHIAELRGVIALRRGNTTQALQFLDQANPQIEPALLPWMRSLAYRANGNPAMAKTETDFLLNHRGLAVLNDISVGSQPTEQSSPQQRRSHSVSLSTGNTFADSPSK